MYTKTGLLTRTYIIMAHMQNIRLVIGRQGKLHDYHIQNVSKKPPTVSFTCIHRICQTNAAKLFLTRLVTLRTIWKWTNCA